MTKFVFRRARFSLELRREFKFQQCTRSATDEINWITPTEDHLFQKAPGHFQFNIGAAFYPMLHAGGSHGLEHGRLPRPTHVYTSCNVRWCSIFTNTKHPNLRFPPSSPVSSAAP